MVIIYATRSAVMHLAITGTTVTRIRESLDLMADQTTDASKRRQRINVTDLGLVAPDEEIVNSTPIDQELLSLKLYKTKLGPASKQQDPQVGKLETKPALPQDWQ